MVLDPRTLLLVYALSSLTLGVMLFAFWRAHRSMSWLALWAGGNALLGIGTLFVTLRELIPDLVSIVAANSLNVAGVIALWNGIRLFNGRRTQWQAPLAALPVIAAALAYWTYVDDALAPRTSFMTGIMALGSFACAYELLRYGRRFLPRMAWITGVPLVLNGIALLTRGVLAFTLAPAPGLMTAGGSVSLLVPLIGRILITFGFVVMTAERYIQQRRELEVQLFQSQKMEALGTLAGGIAHDLNNMLVPLLALTKMTAVRMPEGSRERENLGMILEASERARDLVRGILAFARKEEARFDTIDLAQIVRDSLKLLRASIPATIEMRARIDAVPPLTGDSGKLHQVIANLVANAAQAIGERHGTITVEVAEAADDQLPRLLLRAPAPALRLTVSDTGCGMDAAMIARIFDPFFTTKPSGAGTGLGLSVVHRIVEEHGGRIAVASTPGTGARFDIYLPAEPSTLTGAAEPYAVTAA